MLVDEKLNVTELFVAGLVCVCNELWLYLVAVVIDLYDTLGKQTVGSSVEPLSSMMTESVGR